MSGSLAKYEYKILSKLQKDLHGSEVGDEVISIFYHEYRKTTWYSSFPERLKRIANENEITFSVNLTYHQLLYVYMREVFPAIRVKKEFQNRVQMCWPHNLATNFTTRAKLLFDDDDPQTIDSVWYDIASQYFMKAGFRDHYNISVGNVPALEEWTDYLPVYPTDIIQPFNLGYDPSRSLPLYYFASISRISYHYTLRNKVEELLRMRVKVREDPKTKEVVWKNITVNYKYIEGESCSTTARLPLPELWGRYAYLGDDELNWFKGCIFSDAKNPTPGKQIIHLDRVIACDANDSMTYGERVPIDITSKTPVKALFWVAENMTAHENRNFSNFTSNTDNIYKGWSPIGKTSLSYGGEDRLRDIESDHTERVECWNHLPSAPCEAGYNVHCISNEPISPDATVGVILNGNAAKLTVELANTDPRLKPIKITDDQIDKQSSSIDELNEKDDKPRSGDKFRVRVRLLTTKDITIEKLGDDKFKIT